MRISRNFIPISPCHEIAIPYVQECDQSYHWTELATSSSTSTSGADRPSARARPAAVVVGDSIFMYGGMTGAPRTVLSDLWRFDRSVQTWTKLSDDMPSDGQVR